MSASLETFLRGIGIAIAMAILSYLSTAANIAPVIGISAAAIVAALAGVLDQYFSPSGTVAFGNIGKVRS